MGDSRALLTAMRAALAEMHRAGVACEQGDPSGPERYRQACDAVDAIAAKCAEEEESWTPNG